MIIGEIIGILILALVIGAIFFYGFGRRDPWGAFWVFLLILFLAGMAGRYWVTAAGPVIWGYAWLPLIFWIFMIALLIGIATPVQDERIDAPRDRERIISSSDEQRAERDAPSEQEAEAAGAAAAFGIFFWFILLMLIIAILAGFLIL